MIERVVGADEWMDAPAQDTAALGRALGDLRAVNRWLGGTWVVRRHLDPMLRRCPPGKIRVLDVATGSADIPLQLARAYPQVEVTATDAHPQTTEFARSRVGAHPQVQVESADALDLPYPDGAFDFALCSTALHHFDEADAVRVLRELDRVAARGVVVMDLCRSRFGLIGAQLLAATAWRRSQMTRHDGPLSVRRAYTPGEVRRLAARAGLRKARVHTHFMFRLALVVDRT